MCESLGSPGGWSGFELIDTLQSYIRKKKITNKISIHFQENQNHAAEDTDIQIIDKLLTIPKDPKELTLKLKRVLNKRVLASSLKSSRRKSTEFSR